MNGGELWILLLILLTTIILLIGCTNDREKENHPTEKRRATSQAQRRNDYTRETHELYAWPFNSSGRGL
tara:strand:+ start:347 stop:553 length:207 start_codon:yes stop_codon:yes gene_type:complete